MSGWETPSPVKPKTLLAVKDVLPAVQVRDTIGDPASLHVVTPSINTYASEFDVLIMCFDPQTVEEQRWYHNYLLPRLKPGAKIIWTL